MSRDEDRANAGRAVVGRVVTEEIAKGTKHVRLIVEPTLEPGEKIKATLPGGMVVGTVQRTEVPHSVVISDEKALMRWIKEHRPDEIEVHESIRPAFRAHLDRLVKATGHAFDETSGEVIPGIELRDGTPSYRVTPSEEGRAYILQRLSELAGTGILELPNADE